MNLTTELTALNLDAIQQKGVVTAVFPLFAAGVIEVGWIAHARRNFFELHTANQSPVDGDALQRINELPAQNALGAAPPRPKACWPPPNSTTSSLARTTPRLAQ